MTKENANQQGLYTPEMFERFREYTPETRCEKQPNNLSVVWQRGSRSFWEAFRRPNPNKDMSYLGYKFAELGPNQLPEEEFGNGLALAYEYAIAHPKEHILFIRYDHEACVPENDNNAPFRKINGKWQQKRK